MEGQVPGMGTFPGQERGRRGQGKKQAAQRGPPLVPRSPRPRMRLPSVTTMICEGAEGAEPGLELRRDGGTRLRGAHNTRGRNQPGRREQGGPTRVASAQRIHAPMLACEPTLKHALHASAMHARGYMHACSRLKRAAAPASRRSPHTPRAPPPACLHVVAGPVREDVHEAAAVAKGRQVEAQGGAIDAVKFHAGLAHLRGGGVWGCGGVGCVGAQRVGARGGGTTSCKASLAHMPSAVRRGARAHGDADAAHTPCPRRR